MRIRDSSLGQPGVGPIIDPAFNRSDHRRQVGIGEGARHDNDTVRLKLVDLFGSGFTGISVR